jgi:hypothetical protein
MKVAAWQAPLLGSSAEDVLALIRRRIDDCEAEGVAILCCPRGRRWRLGRLRSGRVWDGHPDLRHSFVSCSGRQR